MSLARTRLVPLLALLVPAIAAGCTRGDDPHEAPATAEPQPGSVPVLRHRPGYRSPQRAGEPLPIATVPIAAAPATAAAVEGDHTTAGPRYIDAAAR